MARRAAARDPDSLLTQWAYQIAAQEAGLDGEAVTAGARAEAVSNGHAYPVAQTIVGHLLSGRSSDARAAHARFQDLAARRYVPPAVRSMVASAVGEYDRAIELAAEGCDERDPVLVLYARNFPIYDRVRADPRFADVLRRLRLP